MANDWMAQGNCADKPPSLFFPSDGVGVEVAKRLCVSCGVRPECLEYALHNRIDHGVWGGTSERERRRILKSRRLHLEADLDGADLDGADLDGADIDLDAPSVEQAPRV